MSNAAGDSSKPTLSRSDSDSTPTSALAEVTLPIRWRDLDAYGHVNNSTYLTYLEEARLSWLAGVDGDWYGEHAAPVLAAAHINYRNQLGWPGNIVVQLACTRLGRSSVTIAHRIVAEDDRERVYADGETVLVWIDPATGSSVPLPAIVRERCDVSQC